jgi:Undecaprenyl-phosphate galactose phosphotransferase WbaP
MNTYSELNERIGTFENLIGAASALRPRRFIKSGTKFILACSDFISILLSFWLTFSVFDILGQNLKFSRYIMLGTLLLVFVVTYTLVGLYRSRGFSQIEEIRQLTATTTIIYLSLLAFHGLMSESIYPAAIFVLSWLFAIVLIPIARIAARQLGSIIGIWGEPVVIIGNGELSRKIIQYLGKYPYYGLKPVMVVDGFNKGMRDANTTDIKIPTIPIDQWQSTIETGDKKRVRTAIVVIPELPVAIQDSISRGEHLGFSNIITISPQFNTRNIGLIPLDFGGVLGLEERHYELNHLENWQVHIFDLFLIFLSIPMLLPLFLLIALAIKLDSKGSVFYRQTRIGKGAKVFKVVKFRTMVKDADKVLVKYLEENPKLMAEWKTDHKLKDDPRITRIGKILRKTSLDELPQLLNVLKGEMSLIGPRPIVADEIEHYHDRFTYYTQVPPGISGLWQVSGRNDIGYDERVGLDEYYVRNRSIWMNLHIIVRTIIAVIRRQGAY